MTALRAPVGMWLIARTPTNTRYPCMCGTGRCKPKWCPCAGRPDFEGLPPHCCAPRTQPAPAVIVEDGA